MPKWPVTEDGEDGSDMFSGRGGRIGRYSDLGAGSGGFGGTFRNGGHLPSGSSFQPPQPGKDGLVRITYY